jgi:hypothetical protein
MTTAQPRENGDGLRVIDCWLMSSRGCDSKDGERVETDQLQDIVEPATP